MTSVKSNKQAGTKKKEPISSVINPRVMQPLRAARRAFSLTELLVVMAVIAILGAITIPSAVGLLKSDSMRQVEIQVPGMLSLVRAEATAQNTYAYLYIQEDDKAKDSITR